MKKLAFVAIMALGGVLLYDALTQPPPPDDPGPEVVSHGSDQKESDREEATDVDPRLLARLREIAPDYPDDYARAVLIDYGNTALDVARKHGPVGLDGLRVLGTEGVELMRSQPDTFRQLADRLGGDRSIRMLALLRDHLVATARQGGLPVLIDRIESLEGRAGRLGDQYPQFLPLLVMAPEEVGEVLTLYPEIATECLMIVNLSEGPAGVRKMCDVIKAQAPVAAEWFAARGADGLMLAHTYPELVPHEPPVELEVFLQILRTNSAYLDSLGGPEQRAAAVRAIAALAEADSRLPRVPDGSPARDDGLARGVLLALACEDPYTVRFVCEHGAEGIDVLKSLASQWANSGMSLPRTLYEAYPPTRFARAHRHAWESLVPEETRGAALFALQTFAPWKELEREDWHPKAMDFVVLLGETDGRFPAWAANNEWKRRSGPKGFVSADEEWAEITKRKIDYLNDYSKKAPAPYEYLPLYDTCRLLWVLGKGYQPTTGELFFATVDVAFTAWDIATFGAGAAAREGLEASTKTLGKAALKAGEITATNTGRTAAKTAATRASRGILATATKSPRVVKALGRGGRATADAGLWLMARGANALDGAKALGIALRIGKYVAAETAINAGVSQGVEQAMLFAQRNRNEVVIKQVGEVLSWLNEGGTN